jgi:hypothetical protein
LSSISIEVVEEEQKKTKRRRAFVDTRDEISKYRISKQTFKK